MATDSDVLTRLSEVVRGATSLEAFEDWFVEQTWDDEDATESVLIRSVTGILAESAGNVPDEIATTQLAALLLPVTEWIDGSDWFAPPPEARQSSGTTTVTRSEEERRVPA